MPPYSIFQVTQCFGALVTSYLLSYVLFICCEAPVGRIEKLILMPDRRARLNEDNSTLPCVEDAYKNFRPPEVITKEKEVHENDKNHSTLVAGNSSYL